VKEYTFEGRTPEDALLKASEELNMNIRDMDYTVVEGESRMFGLVKKVTVHVRVPESQMQAIAEEERAVEAIEAKIEEESSISEKAETKAKPVDEPVTEPMALIGEDVRVVLEKLIKLMGMTATIKISETDQDVMVELASETSEDLTGRDGRTLSSIQFIVNRIVNRKADPRKHILIDVDGFKEKHDENLREEARKLVEQAVAANKIFTMGPMNSKDRRIVHLELKDNSDVSTRSEGTGPNRRLLIIPRGYRGGNNRSQNGNKRRSRSRSRKPAAEVNGNK